MGTKAWAIGLMILCTAFTSIAQVFYKLGASRLEFDIISLITNLPLITGMILYIFGAVIMIIAFKGGEVSVLYPIVATSYIWVALLAHFFLKEPFPLIRWLGLVLILGGVYLVAK